MNQRQRLCFVCNDGTPARHIGCKHLASDTPSGSWGLCDACKAAGTCHECADELARENAREAR